MATSVNLMACSSPVRAARSATSSTPGTGAVVVTSGALGRVGSGSGRPVHARDRGRRAPRAGVGVVPLLGGQGGQAQPGRARRGGHVHEHHRTGRRPVGVPVDGRVDEVVDGGGDVCGHRGRLDDRRPPVVVQLSGPAARTAVGAQVGQFVEQAGGGSGAARSRRRQGRPTGRPVSERLGQFGPAYLGVVLAQGAHRVPGADERMGGGAHRSWRQPREPVGQDLRPGLLVHGSLEVGEPVAQPARIAQDVAPFAVGDRPSFGGPLLQLGQILIRPRLHELADPATHQRVGGHGSVVREEPFELRSGAVEAGQGLIKGIVVGIVHTSSQPVQVRLRSSAGKSRPPGQSSNP